MAKRTSRVNESLISFSDKLVKATEQLSETMSNFDSKIEDQNSGFKGFNKTNGILMSISKKMPKKGTFTSLNKVISSNTKAMMKLSNSIGSLINQLSNQELSKTNNINNIDVDKKVNNIDVENNEIKESKETRRSGWESYRERRDREILSRTKKEIPLKFLKVIESIYKPLENMNKELGVSYDTLWEMLGVTRKLYTNFDNMSKQMLKYGVSFKDMLNTQKSIADLTGTTNYLTDKQLAQISIMSEKFGVNNKSMSKLSVLFDTINKTTTDTNDNILDQLGIIADLNHILPSSIFEDIEKASEGIALFGYKNVKNLKDATLLSKKWSMNIEKAYSFMDKMVFNFESSVESLIEIQTLTGQQIDINKLLTASFQGDSKTIQKELRNIAKSSDGNMVGLRKVAETLGVSYSELQLIINNTSSEILDSTDKAEQANKGYSKFWDDAIRMTSSGTTAFSSLYGSLIQTFNLFTSIKRLNTLKNGMNSIEEAIRGTSNATETLKKGGGLKKAFQSSFDWKSMIGTSAMMLSLAGSFWILSKSIKNFNGIDWATLGKAGATMGVFIGATTALIFSAGALGTALDSGAIVPIVTLMGVLGGFSLISMGFAKSAEMMSNSIVKLIKASDPEKISKMVMSLSLMGAMGVPMSTGITVLATSLGILSIGLIPLSKMANNIGDIEKIPTALSGLANIDLSNLPKALSPLDDLIKKLNQVKKLISEINNNKLNVNVGTTNTNNSQKSDIGILSLSSKIDNLIKAISNNSTVDLSSNTIIRLANEIKG